MTYINGLSFPVRGDALTGQEMFKVLDKAKKLELDGNFFFIMIFLLGNKFNGY